MAETEMYWHAGVFVWLITRHFCSSDIQPSQSPVRGETLVTVSLMVILWEMQNWSWLITDLLTLSLGGCSLQVLIRVDVNTFTVTFLAWSQLIRVSDCLNIRSEHAIHDADTGKYHVFWRHEWLSEFTKNMKIRHHNKVLLVSEGARALVNMIGLPRGSRRVTGWHYLRHQRVPGFMPGYHIPSHTIPDHHQPHHQICHRAWQPEKT